MNLLFQLRIISMEYLCLYFFLSIVVLSVALSSNICDGTIVKNGDLHELLNVLESEILEDRFQNEVDDIDESIECIVAESQTFRQHEFHCKPHFMKPYQICLNKDDFTGHSINMVTDFEPLISKTLSRLVNAEAKTHQHAVYIDVGAHVGKHALTVAGNIFNSERARNDVSIVAVEPFTPNLVRLNRSMRRNNYTAFVDTHYITNTVDFEDIEDAGQVVFVKGVNRGMSVISDEIKDKVEELETKYGGDNIFRQKVSSVRLAQIVEYAREEIIKKKESTLITSLSSRTPIIMKLDIEYMEARSVVGSLEVLLGGDPSYFIPYILMEWTVLLSQLNVAYTNGIVQCDYKLVINVIHALMSSNYEAYSDMGQDSVYGYWIKLDNLNDVLHQSHPNILFVHKSFNSLKKTKSSIYELNHKFKYGFDGGHRSYELNNRL